MIAPVALGAVHGHIRAAGQAFGVVAIPGKECDPDAQGHEGPFTLEHIGTRQLVDQGPYDGLALLHILAPREQHRELVTAEPGQETTTFHDPLQALTDLPQELITGGVTQ